MASFRNLTIKGKYAETLTVTNLSDTGKCYIMVSQYGETKGCELSQSKVKKLIGKLNRWVEHKNQEKKE